MNKEQCKQDERTTMRRKKKKSKENEWALIYSNQVMENSQITDAWTKRGDNNPKSLGKGHPSLTHKIHNEIGIRGKRHLKTHIGTLISN